MTETFAQCFAEQLNKLDKDVGYLIDANVKRVEKDRVVLDAKLKSDAIVPIAQFTNDKGEIEVKEGDLVSVIIENIDDGSGSTQLSREKAKRSETMKKIEGALKDGTILEGIVTNKIRGGYHVNINQIRVFLPGSLADIKPSREIVDLEGKVIEFKVMSIDYDKNNILISRKAVLEITSQQEKAKKLELLKEGAIVQGTIKNMTNYGAFVDLGMIDGLLHNSDISWRRTRHPNEILELGQEVTIKVLSLDIETSRVSLGMKQLTEDPWIGVNERFSIGQKYEADVTNLADYGFFAEIAPGVEGLVHVSEISWTNKNMHPSKVVQIGQKVEVMILDLNAENRRLSLGMKQCTLNPWEEFSGKYKIGDTVSGTINSVTDFGLFVSLDAGLECNIDGLIHSSDISWNPNDKAILQYKKGMPVEAAVSAIDVARERISLSIKLLHPDELGIYIQDHGIGSIVSGIVTSMEGKNYIVKLNDKINAILRPSELAYKTDSIERGEREALEIGEEIEAKIVFIDQKKRLIFLSIKDKNRETKIEQERFLQKLKKQANDKSSSTLGDLLKDSLAQANKQEEQPTEQQPSSKENEEVKEDSSETAEKQTKDKD